MVMTHGGPHTGVPVWADIASPDAAATRQFYSGLLGWQVEVNPDPQYGGYGIAKVDGNDVAGVGPQQQQPGPTVWSLYIGTEDLDGLAQAVTAAGGTVVAPPFPVGDQGRMAVFQDPTGGFISGWESAVMTGFQTEGAGAYGWAELNARGVDTVIPFYERVFGWTHRDSDMGPGQRYTEFLKDGVSIAGAWEMNAAMPAEVPTYWQIYFNVDDVDASHRKALDLGGRETVAPQDFPGGRFAIISDPQGASVGLLRLAQQQ
jgi:predicted enzyme related to lactoylglutathione lyase